MMRKSSWISILVLMLGSLVPAADRPWEGKPLPGWTLEESEQVLWESPWVSRKDFHFYGAHFARIRATYFVRIQSAEPVRLAMAGVVQLQPDRSVRLAGFADPAKSRNIARQLQLPGELVVSLIGVPGPYHHLLNDCSFQRLAESSYLIVDGVGKVPLKGFTPPRSTPSGEAYFHFARPELSERARKIRFHASLNIPHTVRVKAEFSLDDMVFGGERSY